MHRFLRPEDPEVRAAQVRSRNNQERAHAGAAAAMSFFVGQTLLTEATALELKSESDEADPLWIAAVLLMILGAIYAGKLTMMSAKCCLRRLQWVNEPQAVVSCDGDESSSSATKGVEMRSSLRRRLGLFERIWPCAGLWSVFKRCWKCWPCAGPFCWIYMQFWPLAGPWR